MATEAEVKNNLEVILLAAEYCRTLQERGVKRSVYNKTLREAIHFLWEKRHTSNKVKAAAYRSVNARGKTFGKREIVYDHAKPYVETMEKILNADKLDVDILRKILEDNIIVCIITTEENKRLDSLGLRSVMPEGDDPNDLLSRYKAAEIIIERNE